MAIRQYIGARYVPRFMGTYDPTQVYEALDVVDNGLGTSYISKIPTPAGTPLNDTTHWTIYGASSGAVINLQNQINAINDELAEIGVRKFIFLGDSYGAGWTPDGDVVGWPDHVVSYLGIPAANHTVYNLGGVGFVNTVSGQNFITMIQNVAISDDPEDITDIVVAGGYNDIGSTVVNIENAIASFKTAASTRFPNARIHVGFIGYSKTRSKYDIATRRNAYIEACALNGIEYLHNTEYSLYNIFNFFASDGYHPNAAGQISIAKAIAQALISGSADVNHLYYPLELTGKNGFTITHAAATLASDYKNGMQTLYSRSGISITPDSGYNYGLCSGTNFIAVGDVTDGLFLGSSFGTPSFSIPCVCRLEGNSYREMTAIISFNQGEVRIALKSLNDAKNNWFNMTTLNVIMLPNFQFTFDSDLI